MKVEYLAVAAGGIGENTWDTEITVSGEDMTIKDALDEAERKIADTDGLIVSIEQVD